MHSSYTFTAGSAVFDEQNLVSAAGLVPVLELAEQTGLSRLIGEHVDLPSARVKSGAVNPAGKLISIIAAMMCGADSIDDAAGGAPRQGRPQGLPSGLPGPVGRHPAAPAGGYFRCDAMLASSPGKEILQRNQDGSEFCAHVTHADVLHPPRPQACRPPSRPPRRVCWQRALSLNPWMGDFVWSLAWLP